MDENQETIVRALRQVGATVQSLAAVGSGCPDLLVGYRSRNYLLEVKDPSKVPSQRRLTEHQAKWHATWGAPVAVVLDVKDALAAIGAYR